MGKTQNKVIRKGLRLKIEQVVVGTLSMLSPIKYVALLAIFLVLSSCRTQPPTIIQKEEVIWTYKDSIVQRDSICYIPIERYVDIVPIYDTLVLSTSIAESRSWVDTSNHILRGVIRNTKAIQYQVKYIEKVVTNDSIVKVDRPIPYPVVEEKRYIPTFAWICIILSILSIILLGVWVYLKFYKPI